MPVSALTKLVLPWSMWPAVPRTRCKLMRGSLPQVDGTRTVGHRRSEGKRRDHCVMRPDR